MGAGGCRWVSVSVGACQLGTRTVGNDIIVKTSGNKRCASDVLCHLSIYLDGF